MKTKQFILATALIGGGPLCTSTSQAQPGEGKGRPGQGKGQRPGEGKGQRPGQGQRPGGGFNRFNPYSQLVLTEAQQKKMAAIQQEQSAAMRKMFESLRDGGGDREAMRAKFTEMREKFAKQSEALLTAAQKKKLAEIRAKGPQRPDRPGGGQRPGGGAGRRDPYAALNLTDDQKKKVTAIQAAESAERRKLFSEGNREGMREKMTAMREKTNKQIEAILTDEQKKKFKEMQSQRPTRPQRRPGGEGKGKQRPGRSDA
jgi:Spy/CpxP family protein refolding chaperone